MTLIHTYEQSITPTNHPIHNLQRSINFGLGGRLIIKSLEKLVYALRPAI